MKDFIKGYYITIEYHNGGAMFGQHCGLFESLSIASDTLKNPPPIGKPTKIVVENYHTKEIIYLYENGKIKIK